MFLVKQVTSAASADIHTFEYMCISEFPRAIVGNGLARAEVLCVEGGLS